MQYKMNTTQKRAFCMELKKLVNGEICHASGVRIAYIISELKKGGAVHSGLTDFEVIVVCGGMS